VTRPVAYHVGRHGQVAGGMTQVVNGYLEWEFERFDTAVIASRDGSRGLRALVLAARAGLALTRVPAHGAVVVVHLSERGSFVREGALLRLARARGLATVAHLHGSEFVPFAAARPRLVAGVLRAADRVIALSEASADVARRYLPEDAVRIVPNAVAPGADREKERLVVFGGAVRRRKGVDVLVEAWRALSARRPGHGWRLVLAGPVVEPDVVPPALEHAEFVGAVDHAELMSLLERSAVAVLPSRDEAMPMFLLEAMARGNAVVSTPVGGIPAVLGGGAGHLVHVGDADALADALERLVVDDGARAASAARARIAFDERYSARAVFPLVEATWAEALSSRSRRSRSRTRPR